MIKFGLLVLAVLAVSVEESTSAAVFDQGKCDQGCRVSTDCPSNAHCVAVSQSSDCGLCLCEAGYKTEGGNCVPRDKKRRERRRQER